MSSSAYNWYNSWLYLIRHMPLSLVEPQIFLRIFFQKSLVCSHHIWWVPNFRFHTVGWVVITSYAVWS
jgi:hypothetical protein